MAMTRLTILNLQGTGRGIAQFSFSLIDQMQCDRAFSSFRGEVAVLWQRP